MPNCVLSRSGLGASKIWLSSHATGLRRRLLKHRGPLGRGLEYAREYVRDCRRQMARRRWNAPGPAPGGQVLMRAASSQLVLVSGVSTGGFQFTTTDKRAADDSAPSPTLAQYAASWLVGL